MRASPSVSWRKTLIRLSFLLHRWLGVSLGLMMLVWCLSGIVMLYKPWPQPDARRALMAHDMLRFDHPPVVPHMDGRFRAMRLVMVGTVPVLQLFPTHGPALAYELRSGAPLAHAHEDASHRLLPLAVRAQVAGTYVDPQGKAGAGVFRGVRQNDQWILDTKGREAGFDRFDFDDEARSIVYLAADTGDIVQVTTRQTRLWAWLGPIPHWLYPALLRAHPALWADVVMLVSGAGILLTGLGLWIGLRRLRNGRRLTPYRGVHAVHHVLGMICGLFLLSWVVTGFLTMTPGGLMAPRAAPEWMDRLTGTVPLSALTPALTLLRTHPGAYREIRVLPLADRGFVYALDKAGKAIRLDDRLLPAPMNLTALDNAARLAGVHGKIVRLDHDDSYYFSTRHTSRLFPVYRVTGEDRARLYLDGTSGAAIFHVDASAKELRWIVYGPHDLDFANWLRHPAVRLFVIVPLLAGMAGLCLSGLCIGVQRILFIRRRRQTAASRKSHNQSATGKDSQVTRAQ